MTYGSLGKFKKQGGIKDEQTRKEGWKGMKEGNRSRMEGRRLLVLPFKLPWLNGFYS